MQSYKVAAIKAARLAGDVILAAWNKPRAVQEKSAAVDLVTETDKACEDLIFSALKSEFADHVFIGEEDTAANGESILTSAPTWIVDPLDGTTNFVHKFPFVCVCIGLVIDKQEAAHTRDIVAMLGTFAPVQPVVGVVYNPILEELFVAVKGQGAECNGVPIRVSPTTQLNKALVATEIGTTRDPETISAMFDRVSRATSATRSVRCCGSCAMNMVGVATGRLDAFYEIGFGGPWDVAAAAVIVTEAGGVLLDPIGPPFDMNSHRVLCGTPSVARDLAAVLADAALSSAEPPAPVVAR